MCGLRPSPTQMLYLYGSVKIYRIHIIILNLKWKGNLYIYTRFIPQSTCPHNDICSLSQGVFFLGGEGHPQLSPNISLSNCYQLSILWHGSDIQCIETAFATDMMCNIYNVIWILFHKRKTFLNPYSTSFLLYCTHKQMYILLVSLSLTFLTPTIYVY